MISYVNFERLWPFNGQKWTVKITKRKDTFNNGSQLNDCNKNFADTCSRYFRSAFLVTLKNERSTVYNTNGIKLIFTKNKTPRSKVSYGIAIIMSNFPHRLLIETKQTFQQRILNAFSNFELRQAPSAQGAGKFSFLQPKSKHYLHLYWEIMKKKLETIWASLCNFS